MGSSGVNLVRRHSAAEEVAPELTGSRRVTRRVGLENVFVWCVARVITVITRAIRGPGLREGLLCQGWAGNEYRPLRGVTGGGASGPAHHPLVLPFPAGFYVRGLDRHGRKHDLARNFRWVEGA